MISIKKKEKENSANLLRRFTKKVRQSGILMSARKNRFNQRAKNKRSVRMSALRRNYLKGLRAEMTKLGEVTPGKKIDLSKIKKSR